MDFPKDDLKWFGEGFDGFPKKLPDDVVEYIIYIIDTRLSDIQTRERLQAFQRSLHQLEKKFLKEYIWQRESIGLELVREEGRWLLKGRTNYGDSVADEWLIVWFLRELSKEFRDAWIRIYDTDGEFLLIEAANALPKWLNPEVAENRIWVNNHRLLIIPLGKEETDPAPLSMKTALTILDDTPARPQHYPKVEKEAFHRLDNYPAAIAENQHHATLPLPRKVAHILQIKPSYIAPVVEAFYLRDPISIRLLQPDKSKRPLIFAPEDFVHVSVRFTKVLYAQLLGQQWNPPAPWDAALDKLVEGGTATEKAEIGIKIAAGMQMLLAHSLFASNKPVREIHLLLEDLESGDDTLPTDDEIAQWPRREDDEGWLNIDFTEFEKELAGKGGGDGKGFGDKGAQDNLKKMVERFNAFLADDEADHKGATELDPMDIDNDSDAEGRDWDDPETDDSNEGDHKTNADEPSIPAASPVGSSSKTTAKSNKKGDDKALESEDEEADAEYAEYEAAYEKFMTLSAAEKALLTDEARELALEQDAEQEEDDEIKKLTEAMEAELFSHGALNLNAKPARAHGKGLLSDGKGKGKAKLEEVAEEDGSEDEDDEDLLDEDYNLADNMLKAFKGQAGLAGPAGNMMKAMGVQFPRDADDEIKSGRIEEAGTSKGKEKV
ncbi:SGT1 protein-domain-containing protein [Paraphoma chrysanthemicola]|uniref:SGT1 protein-domain-containing protein n=1 Tax=Paraphoma chrysanthemicola TaxID=798071 RepID=A0A8K0W4Y9_9PLEO|nr:SGT1 protein-domain-containing protein [Paraphoma chrysanthemicola]